MNFNRVFIAGNLTRDVELKQVGADKVVGQFGLAINHKYKAADGTQKEDVTFVDVEVWGRTAELCAQYLAKGRGAFIEGRLKLETWDDKNGGGKRSKLKVVADSVQFTSGKQDGATSSAPAPARPSAPATPDTDGEPPF